MNAPKYVKVMVDPRLPRSREGDEGDVHAYVDEHGVYHVSQELHDMMKEIGAIHPLN